MSIILQIVRGLMLIAAAMVLVTACNRIPTTRTFQATDITGADFGRDFHLTDHQGKPRSLADFKGKVVVIFFGYTYCPDVCPTTLSDVAGALKQLGADAGRVQVLFVTVDPERDTPQLLARYVPSFNPGFLGLFGTAEQTAQTARDFKVFYTKEPGATPETYSVSHSAGSYIFDPAGRLRLFVNYGQGSAVFAHDIKLLLSE